MMKLTFSSCTAAAALSLGLFAAPAAFAQGTWNLDATTCNPGTGSPNQAQCTAGSVTAAMTAWSGAGTSFTQVKLGDNDPSGFGAIAGNETDFNGQHAFDNKTTGCGTSTAQTNSGCGGTQEFMLIAFSTKVNLTQMSIDYFNGDADVSIYRFDGNFFASGGGGVGAGTGWTLVASEDVDQNGNTFNVNDSTATRTGTATNLYSSWWLISTYIGSTGNSYGLDNHLGDAFKISNFSAGICAGTLSGGSSGATGATAALIAAGNNNGSSCTTTPGGAPEPGSLALAGLALAGVFAARRRPVTALHAA